MFVPPGDEHAYEGSLDGVRASAPPRPGETRPLKKPSAFCVFVETVPGSVTSCVGNGEGSRVPPLQNK